jgi:two-component system, chemotaxis family, sensor kinase CheA
MSQDTISNAEIIQEFLAESRENMDQMERDLMAWEKQPTGREMLDQIFRAVHTLKGTCGFLGFTNLETVAHEAENLLVCIRDGQVKPEPKVITVLLQVLDTIRRHLGHIERTGEEEKQIFGCVLSDLQELQHAAPKTPSAAATESEQAEETGGASSETSIRVEVGLLDRLMNLVGELVLTRNQISQISLSAGPSPLLGTSQKLSHITSELQESIMKTRLQPIGNIWAKFPRMVRDAALASGKKIRVEMSGQQTELDKSIIEVIKDPLTHLIRNCIDHGIEAPERRSSCGKPEQGVIRLKAFHEAGLVHVEISDDGGGIRPELIREAARRRGLVSATEADELTNHDLMQLIFLPGFSTAREVTKLSGRGVGMDVVKTNLERISGSIEVSSSPGEGTLFKIRIPLTLAIVPALIVSSGDERFAIPQVNLRELVRLEGVTEIQRIETVQDARVYRLRGRLLPLICLGHVLGFPPRKTAANPEDEVVNIIVLESEGGPFGLIVDQVHDTQEIVVKPLGRQLKSVTVFAGATIMGDGLVALILDVMGLAQYAHVNENSELLQKPAPAIETTRDAQAAPSETLLLFELGSQSRCAIALSDVTRLEEFTASEIEWEGSTRVVQYRGQIMPLIPLKQLLLTEEEAPGIADISDKFQVVVHTNKNDCYGFLVDQIIDIAEEPLVLQRQGVCPGVRGSAVIQRRVTKILDAGELINLEKKSPLQLKALEMAN